MQEVIFSRKTKKCCDPSPYFNNQLIERLVGHKDLGLKLEEKLSFTNCMNDKINITFKGVGSLHNLRRLLSRQNLRTIYKSFIKRHLDYEEVKSNNYKAILEITGGTE